MSNITSGSVDYFPLISQPTKVNQKFRQSIIGESNTVSPTAYDVIINGRGNSVGDACRSINILNSSGCAVSSGVTNVNLFNSSGIFVNQSNVTYIADVLIDSSVFVTSGVTASQSIYLTTSDDETYQMTTDNYTVVVLNYSGANADVNLPDAIGQTQVFRVKIALDVENEVAVSTESGTDLIDDVTSKTLLAGDAITVQSDGSSNYYIL